MSTNRRLRPRNDANQPEIVKALRKLGYSVEVDHEDILVGVDGVNIWLEIKDPSKTLLKDGRIKAVDTVFKDSQVNRMRSWKGQYAIVWTIEEALEVIEKRGKYESTRTA